MKYPIFILVKDDSSIRIHSDEKSLNYERIDVDSGLYMGWDSEGYPLKVVWRDSGVKLEQTSVNPQLEDMRKTIFKYIDSTAAYYRPDKPFIYDKTLDDYVAILKKMKEHIESAPFNQKVRNFLRRF